MTLVPSFDPRPSKVRIAEARVAGDDALTALMTEIAVDRAAIEGACTHADLYLAGFTLPEIARIAPVVGSRGEHDGDHTDAPPPFDAAAIIALPRPGQSEAMPNYMRNILLGEPLYPSMGDGPTAPPLGEHGAGDVDSLDDGLTENLGGNASRRTDAVQAGDGAIDRRLFDGGKTAFVEGNTIERHLDDSLVGRADDHSQELARQPQGSRIHRKSSAKASSLNPRPRRIKAA
ncbi:hypothetical protein SAMN02745172_02489 [Pseudoxanthobacter soli DSM 19599]|uniref:Uncharacterized protein n=1 Tax=Pseudoxanthobacter soli DSM 19599 TaxID=1123029 RepID=A0A1M7ZM08_9HYPH|nr:hypothetical protein [Pseudoxanthobacter soli]SHO65842.1 hypothetical protein SAMN02745172_02489 [Pseudoxanthobacter soli DSM 19599]